ncbi:MAG: hypothetical protein ACP5N7_00220 [Candidatus Pacearchaeota archaeon]
MEEWRRIKEYPTFFVSSEARIKTLYGKILKQRNPVPLVDLWFSATSKKAISVARAFYKAFVDENLSDRNSLIYLDNNPKNITKENLTTTSLRMKDIISMYEAKEPYQNIANKYHLSVRRIKNILWEAGVSIQKEEAFHLPKHHAKGKMETSVIPAEFHIPYADNCTVRPKVFDANAYLLRQFNYNY